MEDSKVIELLEDIKRDHPTSYRGIIRAYSWRDIKESRPYIFSLVLSLLFLLLVCFSSKNLYQMIEFWKNQILSILPNLLGFNLGGYALIIGFGNTDLVSSLTKKKKGKPSVFQKLSGIFAFTLVLQSFAFLLAYIIDVFMELEFYALSYTIYIIVNSIVLSLISFLGFWSILILPNLVINVFTLGQMHHLHLTKKRLIESRDKK